MKDVMVILGALDRCYWVELREQERTWSASTTEVGPVCSSPICVPMPVCLSKRPEYMPSRVDANLMRLLEFDSNRRLENPRLKGGDNR